MILGGDSSHEIFMKTKYKSRTGQQSDTQAYFEKFSRPIFSQFTHFELRKA